jgi:hypothetical protein
MLAPDPNFFGGEPQIAARDADWQAPDISAHPLGIANHALPAGANVADYRIAADGHDRGDDPVDALR